VTVAPQPARLERQGARLAVVGELTFATVPALARGAVPFPEGETVWEVDLSGVARADSAGLVLLVAWVREARRRGAELRILHVPDQLRAIARVSGVSGLLALGDEDGSRGSPEAP